MLTRFVRGLTRGRLRARVVPVLGPSNVGGEWMCFDSGPWSCAVCRVRRPTGITFTFCPSWLRH